MHIVIGFLSFPSCALGSPQASIATGTVISSGSAAERQRPHVDQAMPQIVTETGHKGLAKDGLFVASHGPGACRSRKKPDRTCESSEPREHRVVQVHQMENEVAVDQAGINAQ